MDNRTTSIKGSTKKHVPWPEKSIPKLCSPLKVLDLGPGGVKPYTLPTDANATEMQITEQTHPYVLTFLAHKLAYESAMVTPGWME